MILIIAIAVLAFLYFKGASTQTALQDAVKNATPNTAATGQGGQGVTNDDTFNHLLDTISKVADTVTKVAKTDVQKN